MSRCVLRLLDRLRDGEAGVQELTEATGASQQNVSKHLGVLLAAGIVGRRKEGTLSLYRITDHAVFELCDSVCGVARAPALGAARSVGGRTVRRRWPLERVLFALAGTMTLASVVLAVAVSPWFLLLTAFVGANQWLYTASGSCPASIVLERAGVSRRCPQ